MAERVPVGDGHGHSNPVRGLGAARIADRFRRSGGWFQALVALSPWHYAIDYRGFESYVETVELHIRECKAVEDAGLRVACLAGFHPADVDKLIDKYRLKPVEALELGLRVVDYVAGLCREGVLDGIGEVGRQHYKTAPERVLVSEIILERAMEYARDYGCLVHMHLENSGADTVLLTHRRAEALGVAPGRGRERLVFHHSKPVMVEKAHELGYPSTLPGIARLLEGVANRLRPVYMVESDYIDDPARPGAVVYPWDMADTINRLVSKGVLDAEAAYKISVDNIVKTYGVEPP
ncbi:MAG: TatD family hydrolase [Desulfurococcales archaeon]|nr:TatD family hydrolase [Desulfurococcales archaeon]